MSSLNVTGEVKSISDLFKCLSSKNPKVVDKLKQINSGKASSEEILKYIKLYELVELAASENCPKLIDIFILKLRSLRYEFFHYIINKYAINNDIIYFFIERFLPATNKDDNIASTLLYIAVNNFKSSDECFWIDQLITNKNNLIITKNVPEIGHNALHEAVIQGIQEFVKYLIDVGNFDINCRSDYGKTCLMFACEKSHFQISNYLLSKKCNINLQDNDDNCALHHAVCSRAENIVKILLDQDDCKLDCRNSKNEIPLGVACSFRSKPFSIIDKFLMHSQCTYETIKDVKLPKRYQHHKQYLKAMAGTGSYEVRVVKCILTGPPGSGKSTFKRRLLGESVVEGESFSTGACEPAIPAGSFRTVANQKAIVDHYSWKTQTLEEEMVWIMHKAEQSPQKILTAGTSAALPTAADNDSITMQYDKPITKIHFLRDRPKAESDDSKKKALDKLSSMITIPAKDRKDILSKISEKQFNDFYIIDTGGQPEFQEILPAIITGPSINFVTFKLTDNLQERYDVIYRSKLHGNSKPYLSCLTNEEVIFHALSSIDCLKQNTHGWKFEEDKLPFEDNSQPAALLIATHKDKVTEKEIKIINEQLTEKIKHSPAFYHKDLVRFRSENSVIFPINTINEDEKEILNEIKNAVHKITEDRFDVLQVPISWLVFNLMLRKRKQPTFKLSTCITYARTLGIELEKEFPALLWFLHYRMGTILYYPSVEELKDIIITDFQIVFGYLTEIIEYCFNFNSNLSTSTVEMFCDQGLISKSNLKKYGKKNIALPKILALLKHLNIMAGPVRNFPDDSNYYFLPCVLKPIEINERPVSLETEATPNTPVSMETNDTSSTTITTVSPFLVSFKCGYVPVGVFCSLVVYCLNQNKWELANKAIQHRNKITFVTGEYNDIVCLTNRHTYLEIELKGKLTTTLPDLCTFIWSNISEGLNEVIRSLHYTVNSDFFRGFPCSCSAIPNPHLAYLNEEETSAFCQDNNSVKIILEDKHTVWLKKTSKLQDFNSQNISNHYLDIKRLYEVDTMVPIADWHTLGIKLGLSKDGLDVIEKDYPRDTRRCRSEMLSLWLKKGDDEVSGPPTWHKLADALKDMEEGQLAEEIRKTKCQPLDCVIAAESTSTSQREPLASESASSSMVVQDITNRKRPNNNTNDDGHCTKKQRNLDYSGNSQNVDMSNYTNFETFKRLEFGENVINLEDVKRGIEDGLQDPLLQKFYTVLGKIFRDALLKHLVQNSIICNTFNKAPSYKVIVSQFKLALLLLNTPSKIHNHCLSFLESFVSVGGPCKQFAENLAEKWKDCFTDSESQNTHVTMEN